FGSDLTISGLKKPNRSVGQQQKFNCSRVSGYITENILLGFYHHGIKLGIFGVSVSMIVYHAAIYSSALSEMMFWDLNFNVCCMYYIFGQNNIICKGGMSDDDGYKKWYRVQRTSMAVMEDLACILHTEASKILEMEALRWSNITYNQSQVQSLCHVFSIDLICLI
ncbi:hypothetical protein ACJX0J_040982, partial [Zea mays]